MTTEASPAFPQPGDVIAGKYRVEGVIQLGGMSIVLAATHLDLGQRVAVKIMSVPAQDAEFCTRRFLREARAASAIRCVHATRILDVGQLESGAPYLVMEHLDGADLDSCVRQHGPLPVTDAVDYVLQACKVIAEAHALGIVHRDLKPSNLFLTTRPDGAGFIKVIDFGISKIDTEPSRPHSLTATSTVMGTPSYMAPEQLRSAREADERTDLWALGVVLYELLAGRPPFRAETITALCAQILSDEPEPLDAVRSDVPPGLSEVIGWAMRKDPGDRPQTIGELAHALGPFASAAGVESAELVVRLEQQPPQELLQRREQLSKLHATVRDEPQTARVCAPRRCAGKDAVRSRAALAGLAVGLSIGAIGLVAYLGVARPAPAPDASVVAPASVEVMPARHPQEPASPVEAHEPPAIHTGALPPVKPASPLVPTPVATASSHESARKSHGPLDDRH